MAEAQNPSGGDVAYINKKEQEQKFFLFLLFSLPLANQSGREEFLRGDFCVLYLLGVVPVCFINARLKVRRVLKPTASLISVTDFFVLWSSLQAFIILNEFM